MGDQCENDRQQLRRAIIDCRERRLIEAAKWAAQQLAGLPRDPAARQPVSAISDPSPCSCAAEEDAYQLALCHFDFREYARAADLLEPHLTVSCASPKTWFLHLYSLYLSREKQRAEKRAAPAGLAAWAASDEYLRRIERAIVDLQVESDGFLLYLLGLVRLDLEDKKGAREALTAAVNAYPCNWSAWLALQTACPDYDTAAELNLPDHFMTTFFRGYLCNEFQRGAEALEVLSTLADRFPSSEALVYGAASAHNVLHNYDEAQRLFEDLRSVNPHRIEGMDMYSNILYVKEEAIALADLARRCTEQDPYRPETCCIVGNYYSLRGHHEKAVVSFQRALKLDPSYLLAWTLMGHEYVELKNPSAAIEAYQRAVTASPRDYRAWYGLGQTYELVNMPYYALHYYRKAADLRPQDARMWNAMGQCYASNAVNDTDSAIRCYQLALPHDAEGVALRCLAKLHKDRLEDVKAASYYKILLERMEAENMHGMDRLEALAFMSHYSRVLHDPEAAEEWRERMFDYGVTLHQVEQAQKNAQNEGLDAGRVRVADVGTPGSDMATTPARI